MQHNQFLSKKSSWLLLFVVAVCSLLFISSCKGKEEKANTPLDDASCMILSEAQINNNWVTTYTKPTNPEGKKISVLKFYASTSSAGLSVSVQAFNSAGETLGKPIALNAGVACDVTLYPFLIGQSYDIEWNSLDIIDPTNGNLKPDFRNIILRPSTYTYPGTALTFLRFDVDVYIGNALPPDLPYVLPCPPCINCRPVCIDKDSTLETPPPTSEPATDTTHM